MIKITEGELFRYVFFPEQLNDEQRDVIESTDEFMAGVRFYNSLRDSLNEQIPAGLKRKLASRIEAYKLQQVFELYPVKPPEAVRRKDVLILAAASEDPKPKISVKTFVDEEKNLLIKFLNFGEYSKVYIFSSKDEILTNLRIKFLPQNTEYSLKDNSEPLTTELTTDPDLIRVELG
ncbi:MAG: hypothetical protein Kow0098_04780 [Ignavibacteriaceae bacterium]